ncbi:Flp pilus assembly complex ATPase component TadA [Salmonella enterica]
MIDDMHLPLDFVKKTRVLLTRERFLLSPNSVDPVIIQTLYRSLGEWFNWQQCSETQFNDLLREYYGDVSDSFAYLAENGSFRDVLSVPEDDPELLFSNDDAPVIRLIDSMIDEAIILRASDIHIEPFSHQLDIRFRVDGFLQLMSSCDIRLAAPVISRLKIMAGLDIAERRLPQDGRIFFKKNSRDIDIRISVIPVAEGERVVLRLLSKGNLSLDLASFGMSASVLENTRKIIRQPHGMLLVTGPTGSGKSTTLYACLNEISVPEKNILTIEDPVEYVMDHIGQTQVNNRSGLTFAKGLRALLRQDPDVVMIGEIRDNETAAIAIQAAMTGHMVFSTLHTNTSAGAISRLRDMNVEPYLVSSVLSGVISQRLVRVLCQACKIQTDCTRGQAALTGLEAGTPVWNAKGCPKCYFQGYFGRTGIYELMAVDETVREMIHSRTSDREITRYLALDFSGMQADGLDKIRAGVTSVEELCRVTSFI